MDGTSLHRRQRTGGWHGMLARPVSAIVVIAALAIGLVAPLASPAPSAAQAIDFAPGDSVVVDTDALNMRSGPGTATTVTDVLVNGTVGTVTDGPVIGPDWTWFEINVAGVGSGWVAGEFLALSDEGSDEFPIGAIVAVNTDLLNVRAAPGLNGRIADRIGFGATGEVSRDPVEADGHTWYRLRIANAADGWVAGEFLVLAGDLIFPIGTMVRVDTDLLNVRVAPGLDQRIVDRIGFGAVGEVSRVPVEADGHTWYRLRIANAADGWVAGEFLIAA